MVHLTLQSSSRVVADSEAVGQSPPKDFLHNLDEKTLAYQLGASMRNVACIYLNVGGRKVSCWMNTGSGVEGKEWTTVQLEETATTGGLSKLLGHTISLMSPIIT